MVEVSMAQHHSVNFGCVERKRVAVAFLILSAALNQPAVQQHFSTANMQDVTGTGYFGGSAEKFKFHITGV